MSEELKHCPFCGSKVLELGELRGILDGQMFVHCLKCKASGPLGKYGKDEEASAMEAVKAWNRRKQ